MAAEYVIGKVVVRIHGEVDQKRIEKACLAYLANTTPNPSKQQRRTQECRTQSPSN